MDSKYAVAQLFDLNAAVLGECLGRLRKQAEIYRDAGPKARRKMECRALFATSFTLNATLTWTAKLLRRGKFSMGTQRIFFQRRLRKDPKDWGLTPKACFARALSGHTITKDGVCVDRHLERLGIEPEDAPGQWAQWFGVYTAIYGQGETARCIRWHIELLDWIALAAERPSTWK